MQALVGGRVAGLEDERRVVGDHPDAHAEEVEDRAHPLRVAPGEVVVDGDDVDAAAGQRVEDGGQRRRRASCPRRSASRRSCPGGGRRRPSAGRRSGASRASASSPRGSSRRPRAGRRRAPSGGARSRACGGPCVSSRRRSRSGWWSSSSDGSSGSAASRISARISANCGADLLVGEGLELGLERVGLVDQRLEASDLAVVRVDEAGQEVHGR